MVLLSDFYLAGKDRSAKTTKRQIRTAVLKLQKHELIILGNLKIIPLKSVK